MIRRLIGPSLCLLLLNACGSMDRFVVGQAGSLFQKAAKGLENEGHFPSFKDSVLANIKLIEGLLAVKPKDEALLLTAVKAHSGAAFGVYETAYFDSYYQHEKNSEHPEVVAAKNRALYHYSQAMTYGHQWLNEQGLKFEDMVALSNDAEKLHGDLKSRVGSDTEGLEGLLFYAQSLGGFINLQQDRMELIVYLSLAKNIFDYVCKVSPDIYWGTCDIFYAAYEAGRPSMLGGNPEKGQKIFKDLLVKYPDHWLAYASYVQFYVVTQADRAEFKTIMEKVETPVSTWDEGLLWSPSVMAPEVKQSAERVKLFQSIGIERLKILKKYENRIF